MYASMSNSLRGLNGDEAFVRTIKQPVHAALDKLCRCVWIMECTTPNLLRYGCRYQGILDYSLEFLVDTFARFVCSMNYYNRLYKKGNSSTVFCIKFLENDLVHGVSPVPIILNDYNIAM